LRIFDYSREEQHSHFQNLISIWLQSFLESRSGKMVSQDLTKDSLDDIVSRSVHSNGREVSLQAEIHSERT
jgi:hypothetical protein